MDPFIYVPGKTDIYSLPRDILILLLTRIEKDTTDHFKNHDEELQELRFIVRNCNCEYRFHKCEFPNCKAKVLLHGKYDDVYEDCNDLIQCKCPGNHYFCDKHIPCAECKTCDKCSEHEPCKYCNIKICSSNGQNHLPPKLIKNKPGLCQCGHELEQVPNYVCGNCRYYGTYRYENYHGINKIKRKCVECDRDKSIDRTFYTYECVTCEDKNQKLIIPECKRCELQRHFGCKFFWMLFKM